MAWLKCPNEYKCGAKFRIMTESGTTYGTNMSYIECCPFCGHDMDDSDVVSKE